MTVSQSHLTMHSNISTETSLNLSSLHISYAYSQVLKHNSSLNKKKLFIQNYSSNCTLNKFAKGKSMKFCQSVYNQELVVYKKL